MVFDLMNMRVSEEVKRELLANPLVVGVSNTLKPKIRGGRETGEESIRVYVVRKLPSEAIPSPYVIPEEIGGVKTDVVEVGFVEKHSLSLKERTSPQRPLKAGVSIGNMAITAGTLGGYYAVGKEVFLISNAHVFTENPMAREQREKRIVQPGSYDLKNAGLNPEDYVVAELYRYVRVKRYTGGSDCPVSRFIVSSLNAVSRLLGRRTRFTTYVEEKNMVDVALARLIDDVEIDEEFIEGKEEYNEVSAVGLLFAGSDYATLVCKAKHIDYELGGRFWGVYSEIYSLNVGDRVCKVGRTTGYSCGRIVDESADMKVWYGSDYALFSDVYVTTPISRPGDSGSMVYTMAEWVAGIGRCEE